MKSDYWNVTDAQVIARTGRTIEDWMQILTNLDATWKRSSQIVSYLRDELGVPRYWARTLVTLHAKRVAGGARG